MAYCLINQGVVNLKSIAIFLSSDSFEVVSKIATKSNLAREMWVTGF